MTAASSNTSNWKIDFGDESRATSDELGIDAKSISTTDPTIKRIDRLRRETATAAWDGEDATQIPAHLWEIAVSMYLNIATHFPSLPPPYPSPSGDGTALLAWTLSPTTELSFEILSTTRFVWSLRRAGGGFESGECLGHEAATRVVRSAMRS